MTDETLDVGPRGRALGRDLSELLSSLGPARYPEDTGVLPQMEIDGDVRGYKPKGIKAGALMNRLQPEHRPVAGQALSAIFDAVNTADYDAQRQELERTYADYDVMVHREPQFPDAANFRIVMMDIELIHPNPFVPLSYVDHESLQQLAESIRVHGFLRPLVVMPSTVGPVLGSEGYWLIAGERSWQVARLAGIQRVPVRIQEVTPREAIQMILAEDWHAQRLPSVDRAHLCEVLIDQMGMTLEGVAQRLAITVDEVESTVSLLCLEPDMRETLTTHQISEEVARLLAHVDDLALRRQLWRYAVRFEWTPQRLQRAINRRVEQVESEVA